MVKVTFQQWEEVIIHEWVQYTLDELIHTQTIGVQAGGLARPLSWAEGVVFTHMSLPPTEDIVREQLQGKIHWNSVHWALMPEYRNIIVLREANVRIPIRDVSGNRVLTDVAKELKKRAVEATQNKTRNQLPT